MVALWTKWFGDENAAALRRIFPIVSAVNSFESGFQALSDEALKAKTEEFKQRLHKGDTLDTLLPEAFALVREASRRTLGQRHFDVQLLGGAALHSHSIAEMRTGEGKTLVATLPAYLNALTGKGVHIVTVNDYLSRRDAVWMGQIYNFLGLSVGVLNHESSFLYDPAHVPKEEVVSDDEKRDELGSFKVVHEFLRSCSRREAYAADITYGTNNEFGFDYLRDNLEYEAKDLRQREHYFAIVDEVDSILIDEARTPLIISAPVSDAENLYDRFTEIARSLNVEEDYAIDEKHKQIALTDSGIEKAQKALGIENIYTDAGIKYVHHLEIAVRAKAIFHRDKEYVVQGGQVVIVDEFTGRLQPGRRWSDGLHQAIEAKEGVSIQQESRTFASITFQNYFRLYDKLAGMTGTATTSAEEFFKVYGLETISIPTNKPSARIDHDDYIFQTENGKMRAIAREVKTRSDRGQPVLVGTASVEKNELLSAHFKQEGIPHELLNAKNHEREGEIIAQAGRKGAVTIATNMAGRGVDIKLGGNPATEEEAEEVKILGGLCVFGTERHEARRIDNQLRGRSGRQGDPGETRFFVSLEDSLMRVFASETIKKVMGTLNLPEDEPIHTGMITRALEKAQKRIEELNFDARKYVLAYDDVLNVQRKSIYARRRTMLVGDNAAVEKEIARVALLESALGRIISDKRMELGDAFLPAVRRLFLQAADFLWVEHLEAMEYLRSSVNLRAYGQRDPLVEYKKEGLRLFQGMESAYVNYVTQILPKLVVRPEQSQAATGVGIFPRRSLTPAPRKEYGRNDKVKITDGKETREIKYKKAGPLLETGEWRIVG
ncbi:preprotein translocase subunit SecA [Candidatus Kaiserbacteria bacterium RIFCSPHIGHO2_01_FULL_50_13]|uniref:Protein translocase subunit SecA n=1 Tax=Candidatus Kaiserbacteria bacterium RIFCSPLOWO2_01_FULL_50_24 TaxID=1798507 RepID=A0A1F6EIC3_9BACT|nr:MAG: preprotein translocase subunit SecA [Candidatus Kaiserbacteria bacterium RIFCSPHIGHO2_01_FULL_50_13]OGG73368.1 MAG: preprotein translocase subunit SecA [Candidatus Kaiserbacteria bacterium RIFCSPLOWO2_01_FULL_50_24]OGG80880.1 MAG: preprotein translocase subunit SecA [Candidatus Kaiserbacteria bacterium RIFCSPLOWO2_02_FULL_51_13]